MKYVAILPFLIIIIVMIDRPGIKVIAGNQHCFSCKGSCLQCITGYYGDYCNKKCHCSEGQQCDRESGTCTNEVTRYSVSNSNNWSYKCSDCNGTCEACIRGWHGEMCTLPCINCTIDGCNKTTGICKNCKHNFYGPNCDKPCPPHCHSAVDETSCHRENGFCYDGCQHGHYGQTCNLTCSSGCMNQTCHYDGTCIDGCKERYSGRFCDSCNVSFYGPKCDKQCAPGCVNHICSRNGSCECLAGYTGDNCETKSLATQLKKFLLHYYSFFLHFAFLIIGCVLGSYTENKFHWNQRIMKKICTEKQDNTSTGESDQPFLN